MAKKKRKPRTRRKQVVPSQPNEIPYSKYRIEWLDILSDSGWASDREFNRISQHLNTIASAQDKIILIQAMAEECGINVTDEKQGK